MAEEDKEKNFPKPTESDQEPHGIVAPEVARPEAPRAFSMRQVSFSIPKPAYHRHLEEGAELGQPEELEFKEWHDSVEDESAYEKAAAAKRARARKIRWWGLLLFIFLYAAFKLVRFNN